MSKPQASKSIGLLSSALAQPFAQRLLVRWRSSRLVRAVLTMAGGSVVAQGLSLFTAPITTRLYAPADYGIAAVFGSLIGILSILATFRYETAIVLPQDQEKSREVLMACVLLASVVTAIILVLAWSCGNWVSAWLGVPTLSRYWWLVPVGLLGSALYQSFYYWTLRQRSYSALAGTRVRQAVGGALVTIGAGCLLESPIGLLLGACVSSSVGVGRLSRGAFSGTRVGEETSFLQRSQRALRSYARFALLSTGAALLNSMGLLLPPLLFAALYSQKVVGSFSLAQRVVLLPGTLIGAAVAQVFLSEASAMVRERPADLPAFFRSVTRKMVPLSLGLLFIGAICPWVFPLAFGAQWEMSGRFAALLALSCSAQLIVSPVASVSILLQRQDLQFALDALRAVVVIGAIWLPFHYHRGPLSAVSCYALGMTLMYGFYYLLYCRLVNRFSRTACGL